jgi:HSP20 family protein
LTEPWWRRKRNRDKSEYPWFDLFEEFDKLEDMMNEIIQNAFGEEKTENFKAFRPHVYGFSMSIGSDGNPVVRQFGNIQKNRNGTKIKEEQEPLVDVLEEENQVVVVVELPGVEKEEINLHTTEDALTISVGTTDRRYHKELILPAKIDPKSARASYKNGVLEVRLKKAVEKTFKGEKISVK